MSKRLTPIAKTGLKIALVAFLLAALSTEVFARSGSSGRGREGDNRGRTISIESGADNSGRGRDRIREGREVREARVNIRNDHDVIEERTRLVAEPMATASEVKLRLEFSTKASTTNQVAQETLNRMRLSREEIDRLLVIKQAEAEIVDDFSASLRGNEEVPAVVTNASGSADFELQRGDTRLAFTLNVTNTENAIAAHIHQGIRGENGPIVANLFLGPTRTGLFSGVLAQGIIEVQDLVGPLAGRPFSDLVDLLRSGRAYANIHTTQNPGGEIRGQIMTMAQDKQINERLRVRADVKADMTGVRADFKFAVASTSRAQIIDRIFARLSALRLDNILNVLDLRIMAEQRCDIIIDDEDRRGPNRGRR